MLTGPIGAGKTNSLMSEYSLRVGEAVLRSRTRAAETTARIEAEVANRVKSEFLSTMSHELRTPLNTVIGFSKILMNPGRGPLNQSQMVEYATLIQDAAVHLLALINDILDISKIQSGRYSIDSQDVNIEEILQANVAGLRTACAEAGLEIVCQVAPDLPFVRGDAKKLGQVFANVLSNAIKFTPAGGQVWVEARTLGDGSVSVVIRDTGVGMDEEEIKIALTPFGQVDGGHTRWREGAGLGLPIAKSLIELHSGRLTIQSAKSMGTEVQIILPSPRFVTAVQRGGLSAPHVAGVN